MATFLMIHGSWHGGWCFEPLRTGLEQHGHTLLNPNLPGTNGEKTALADVSLDLWAQFVADLAAQQSAPVILCGHSRGGIVISQAAERAPDLFPCLVYISAFMLPSGMSLKDSTAAAVPPPAYAPALSPTEDGLAVNFDPAYAADNFYSITPKEIAEKHIPKMVPEPAKPLVTKLALSEENYGRVPRVYIECTEDQAIPLARQRAMQAVLPCKTVNTLHSDHSPFLCCPDDLVAALDHIAQEFQ